MKTETGIFSNVTMYVIGCTRAVRGKRPRLDILGRIHRHRPSFRPYVYQNGVCYDNSRIADSERREQNTLSKKGTDFINLNY